MFNFKIFSIVFLEVIFCVFCKSLQELETDQVQKQVKYIEMVRLKFVILKKSMLFFCWWSVLVSGPSLTHPAPGQMGHVMEILLSNLWFWMGPGVNNPSLPPILLIEKDLNGEAIGIKGE